MSRSREWSREREMDAVRRRVSHFISKRDNVINVFLLGAFVALGIRSTKQQREIEALEAEKSRLKSSNRAMSSAMWEWRQHLFGLAEADPPALPISISRLRAIYGEDQPPEDRGLEVDAEEDSIPIA